MSIYTDPSVIPELLKIPGTRNFMKTMIFHGCARPMYVYIETFVPAFIDLFILLSLGDAEDILRAYAQALAGERPSGRRRHGTKRGEKRVPARPSGAAVTSRKGLIHILKITTPLEAASFIFLAVAGADRFFMDWQALIESAPFCTNPQSTGPFSRTDPASSLTVRDFGQGFGYDTLEQNRGNWANNGVSVTIPGGHIFITADLIGQAGLFGMQRGALGLKLTVGGQTKNIIGDFQTLQPGEKTTLTVTWRGTVPIGANLGVQWAMFGDDQLAAFFPERGSVIAWIEEDGLGFN